MRRAMAPDVLAVHVDEGVLSGAYGVQQPAPGLPVRGAPDEGRPGGHRALRIRAQGLAQRREREALRLALVQDRDARQRAQHAVERLCVRAGGSRQLCGTVLALRQQIGNAERRRDVESLGQLVAVDQPPQVQCRV
jgi:hypothetical protein